MDEKIKIVAAQIGDFRIKKNLELSEYLYSRKKCFVPALFIATNSRELIKITSLCRQLGLKFFIFGTGSKIVLPENFSGIAIKNRSRNIKIFGIKGKISRNGLGIEHAFIQADSGCTLSEVAEFTLKQGLAGFEAPALVGTIGGSLFSNAIIRSKIDKVEIAGSYEQAETIDLDKLKSTDIILSAIFKLKARV